MLMKTCTSPAPVNVTLKVMGGKWKPIILWQLYQETMRFSRLKNEVGGITQKMLTQQLRELEQDGLVNRHVYAEIPPKVEYTLTDYGRTLVPVLQAMAQWGEMHKQRLVG